MQFFYEKPAKVSPSFHLENDSNGEPRFNIPEPTPAHLFVHGALTYEYWHCTCVFMGPTEAVVHKGVVEAPPKAKIRVMTRRSYGFRTFAAMEIALYHTLGRLPEPKSTHTYC